MNADLRKRMDDLIDLPSGARARGQGSPSPKLLIDIATLLGLLDRAEEALRFISTAAMDSQAQRDHVRDRARSALSEPRVLAVGQYLGTANRIDQLRYRKRGGWLMTDSTGATYSQRQWPEGFRTWDKPTPGDTHSERTPWPPAPKEVDGG